MTMPAQCSIGSWTARSPIAWRETATTPLACENDFGNRALEQVVGDERGGHVRTLTLEADFKSSGPMDDDAPLTIGEVAESAG